jgi:hypothetical protein
VSAHIGGVPVEELISGTLPFLAMGVAAFGSLRIRLRKAVADDVGRAE